MELIYFTIIGGALYLAAERILNLIESKRGARLPYRSLVFFAIIFTLSMGTFSGIRALTEPPQESTSPAAVQEKEPETSPARAN
ncbi:MAG: hypothetical protein HQL91_09545 [Magnetococcales bacterium]|nr:hypothetical protein [Magnetococcales bacterium]